MDGEFNAKITSTYLGGWDSSTPPPLVVGLVFEGDGWGQGSGYYSGPVDRFVAGVCHILGVSSWEEVGGQFCRVRRKDGLITEVGNFIKEDWFSFKEAE